MSSKALQENNAIILFGHPVAGSEKLGSFRDGDAIDEIEDDDVLKAAVEDSQRTAFAAPMSYSDLEKTTDVPNWVISYKNLPKAITSVDITENFDQLPKDDGIYVPYVPQLSQQDPQAFPEFLRTFVVQSFGEDVESAISNCDEVARQWGLISKTEFGDEAAHYVTAVKMALQGQARPLPLIRQGRYVGAAIIIGDADEDKANKNERCLTCPVGRILLV